MVEDSEEAYAMVKRLYERRAVGKQSIRSQD